MKKAKQTGISPLGIRLGFVVGAAIIGLMVFFMISHEPAYVKSAHPEMIAIHKHVMIEGIEVPAGIGIYGNLWENHMLDEYGANGMAPLHTHDKSGLVHIESKENREFTLGDFFSIWGVGVSSACVIPQGANPEVALQDGFDDTCQPIGPSYVLGDGDKIRATA